MNRLDLLRILMWVIPLGLTYLFILVRRPTRRLLTATLLGLVWNLWAVLAVNVLAMDRGFWTFSSELPAFMGMPVELWAGWVLLWGAVAPLVAFRQSLVSTLVGFLWLDLIVMPSLDPFVVLSSFWPVGELIALQVAFLPGLLIFRWTVADTNLRGRASLQVIGAGGILLWLVPSIAFEVNDGWGQVLDLPIWRLTLATQLLLLAAIPGVRAVMEFVHSGNGTSLPYDPPHRLVTTGPYSFVRNPMQVSMVLAFVMVAITLWNPWLMGAAAVAAAYGAGLAEWHENLELTERFGTSWVGYRERVRPWLPTLRPAVAEEAILLVAFSCQTCSSVGRWFVARHPTGLKIAPAEDSVDTGIRRVTYLSADGRTSRGITAIARSLEHIHIGWAIVGWVLAMPIVSHFAQVVVDVFGPAPHQVAGLPYDESACTIDGLPADADRHVLSARRLERGSR
jgi:protein-S-isoprenylcysteine O-methyltransferase Ste14